MEHSYARAYSSEESGIVERANQEVLRHLRALLFVSRVHDKWSFEQLPLVQRIMNTVEKTSTGVTQAELNPNHSIRLSSHIMTPISSIDLMKNPCPIGWMNGSHDNLPYWWWPMKIN